MFGSVNFSDIIALKMRRRKIFRFTTTYENDGKKEMKQFWEANAHSMRLLEHKFCHTLHVSHSHTENELCTKFTDLIETTIFCIVSYSFSIYFLFGFFLEKIAEKWLKIRVKRKENYHKWVVSSSNRIEKTKKRKQWQRIFSSHFFCFLSIFFCLVLSFCLNDQ